MIMLSTSEHHFTRESTPVTGQVQRHKIIAAPDHLIKSPFYIDLLPTVRPVPVCCADPDRTRFIKSNWWSAVAFGDIEAERSFDIRSPRMFAIKCYNQISICLRLTC